jgi:hypothetical protein
MICTSAPFKDKDDKDLRKDQETGSRATRRRSAGLRALPFSSVSLTDGKEYPSWKPFKQALWTRVLPMKAFISYAHHDIEMLQRLKAHSSVLVREGRITLWYDREITAGGILSRQISAQLDASDLFIPLVSPDFLNSEYCYQREMRRAAERRRRGLIMIAPIILEPCDWMSTVLGRYKALPQHVGQRERSLPGCGHGAAPAVHGPAVSGGAPLRCATTRHIS